MSDGYSPKTYREQGGDRFVVAAGGKIAYEVATLAAIGNSQATAAAIACQVTRVTSADNTLAVVLPTAVVGDTFVVINSVANKTLPVYPATGAQINAGGANAAFTVGPGKAAAFHCTALLTWYVDGQAAATPTVAQLTTLIGAGDVGALHTHAAAYSALAHTHALAAGATDVTASAAEVNTLAASGITNADLVKVHALTATAAQINALAYAQYFKTSPTVAQINAGTFACVPAIAGKQFYPLFAAFVSHTSAADSTLVRLVEDGGGVVMSHAIADLADGVWASITGGVVVTTLLNTALTANKAILINATVAPLTGTVTMDVVVCGYYL
jgi:hypothetical protein